MATMTIRNIDDQPKARLRIQAATHGRSMEDEARDILPPSCPPNRCVPLRCWKMTVLDTSVLSEILRSRGAGLATRNTRDFVGLNLPLVNPWEA